MDFLKNNADYIVIIILAFMSFVALWLSVERFLFYKRVKSSDYKSKEIYEKDLTKNLTALYIIYSNAPYVGLLGTVVGIMITFYDMGLSGNIDPKSIMTGLSLALKATAFGLVVAIPTLMIYNAFLRKVDVLLIEFSEENSEEKA